MTDRELLELAAKAAGIDLWHEDVFTNGLTQKVSANGVLRWNPLTDDGDALRLAVKLSIDVLQRDTEPAEVWAQAPLQRTVVVIVAVDRQNATRRAIVRAAAEIGWKK